jgi:16S rRNA (cytidine1402-2'-O)-methyltransferase
MPSLYVVATPIGNLEDVSLRALRVLKEVGLIAAEDTRKTVRLLSRYDINTPMTSFYEHSKLAKVDYILGILETKDVAIVSEAGMPGISDPGYELITAAIERNILIVPVPGPSAVVTALAVSGLPAERFTYIGFLSHKQGERKKQLESVANEPGAIVAFETPHRIEAALKDILSVLGDRRIAVCRELTKMHEEIYRGTVAGAISHFSEPRGEFTLVIEGSREKEKPPEAVDVRERVEALIKEGASAKEVVATFAIEKGISKKELYRLFLEIKGKKNNISR